MEFKVGDRVRVTKLAISGFKGVSNDPEFANWLSKTHVITEINTLKGLSTNWPYHLDGKYYFSASEIEKAPEPTFAQKEIDGVLSDPDFTTTYKIKVMGYGSATKWLSVSAEQLTAIRNILGE